MSGSGCQKCGHTSSFHGATFCNHRSGYGTHRVCDCDGWGAAPRAEGTPCCGCRWVGETGEAQAGCSCACHRERAAHRAEGLDVVVAAIIDSARLTPDGDGYRIPWQAFDELRALLARLSRPSDERQEKDR